MVPLIDVMLVLLIIFMVTAPLLTHAVKVDLPRAASHANDDLQAAIRLSLAARDQLYWNGEKIAASELEERLRQAAEQQPQPELQIAAERTTPYEEVARLMSAAARQGVRRIGFVTDPGMR